ncbi:MAG: hypothetical protein WD533_08265, partial [Dehalococcoidia bacterium]
MVIPSFEQRANRVVAQLLEPGRRNDLEQFRFHGSTNRVYRIPLDQGTDEFVIVKLLPGWYQELRIALKRPVRNL